MNRDARDIAARIMKLADCGLFDERWYLFAYPGVAADGGNPLVHFCNAGWLNGFKPNFYFDAAAYASAFASAFSSTAAEPDPFLADPLVHYIDGGEKAGLAPSLHFNPGWYRQTYDIQQDANCLADYLSRRRAEPLNPHPGFDAAWYGGVYEDVRAQGLDLYEHYIMFGAKEGREASPEAKVIRESGMFDPDYYLATYPHVASSGLDPLFHYCAFGWRDEGCNPNADFDTLFYISANDDVRQAGFNPLYHYVLCGAHEHRAMTPVVQTARSDDVDDDMAVIAESELLDVNYYLINYPDVRASAQDPLEHFCRYGWQEGRRPNPYFDAGWYLKTYFSNSEPQNPLVDYIKHGEAIGRRPIVYFDPAWYRETYAIGKGRPVLKHYLDNRRRQIVSPLALFDVDFYMGLHSAEIGPNRDPFAHFLRVGIMSDFDPGPGFNAKSYRSSKMDPNVTRSQAVAGAEIHERVKREALNPLVHFLLAQFTPAAEASIPDVATSVETPRAVYEQSEILQ